MDSPLGFCSSMQEGKVFVNLGLHKCQQGSLSFTRGLFCLEGVSWCSVTSSSGCFINNYPDSLMDEDNIWVSSAQQRKTDDHFWWKLPLAIWKWRSRSLRLTLSKDVGPYQKPLKTRFQGLDHSQIWAWAAENLLCFRKSTRGKTPRKGGKSS